MFDSALTLDIPFSRKVLEHLRAHPEEHTQDWFGARNACGTTACIAGTAVLMDSQSTIKWISDGFDCAIVNGRKIDIAIRAADLLGLNHNDANQLFYDYKNASALDRLADYIAAAEEAQS